MSAAAALAPVRTSEPGKTGPKAWFLPASHAGRHWLSARDYIVVPRDTAVDGRAVEGMHDGLRDAARGPGPSVWVWDYFDAVEWTAAHGPLPTYDD